MVRAFFGTIGVFLIVLGAQCLVLDKAVLADFKEPSTPQEKVSSLFMPTEQTVDAKIIQPPEWASWSLMSAGAVILLYSISIPKRSE